MEENLHSRFHFGTWTAYHNARFCSANWAGNIGIIEQTQCRCMAPCKCFPLFSEFFVISLGKKRAMWQKVLVIFVCYQTYGDLIILHWGYTLCHRKKWVLKKGYKLYKGTSMSQEFFIIRASVASRINRDNFLRPSCEAPWQLITSIVDLGLKQVSKEITYPIWVQI